MGGTWTDENEEPNVSFEARLGALGRALDDAVDALRERASRVRPFDAGAMKDAVSSGVSRAYDRTRAAVAVEGSRLVTRENRARVGVVLLVVASVLATAVITSRLTDGEKPFSGSADDQALRGIAAERDRMKSPAGTPRPVRATSARPPGDRPSK